MKKKTKKYLVLINYYLKNFLLLINFYVLAKLMPNLSARTPACITTMRPSAIKLIVCEGSMVKKLFSLFSTQK